MGRSKKGPRAEDVLPKAEDEHGEASGESTATAVAEPPKGETAKGDALKGEDPKKGEKPSRLDPSITEDYKRFKADAEKAGRELEEAKHALELPFFRRIIQHCETQEAEALQECGDFETKGDELANARARVQAAREMAKLFSVDNLQKVHTRAVNDLREFEKENSVFLQANAQTKAGLVHADTTPPAEPTQPLRPSRTSTRTLRISPGPGSSPGSLGRVTERKTCGP